MRSGQTVTYDGHVTVLGNIHPGAQVTATGNIVILGTCSGSVHAGQSGNQKAYIIALNIKNGHLRIADHILYPEMETSLTGPVIASINQNKITLADYINKRP